ncbi:MAG: S4 domain-containing protein YaaA [Erysipelotrichaceae bacterium]|jgi:S4 domain protein YaaA|nr:S4 domain-containing protein YaaA [Erysipelotrichaceae bacterium]
MKDVAISTDYITLGQFLKYTGIITSGSDVKQYLSTNEVFVNDDTETRRGRKIYPGDNVRIKSITYLVIKKEK